MPKKLLSLTILLAAGLFYLTPIQAQHTVSDSTLSERTSYTPATGIRGALMGSIIYPGLKAGVERPFKYTQVSKQRAFKTKTHYREQYISYSLGVYHQASYHTNFLLQTEWLSRKQKSRGFYYELALGTGLSRTFVDGASFTVTDNGEVKQIHLSGNWFALASLGGSIGYNANLTQQKPYAIYLKHQWLFLLPYNAFVTPRPVVELGLNYNLSGFWEAIPKAHYKKKQRITYRKSQSQNL